MVKSIQSSLRYSRVLSKDSLGPKIVFTKEFIDEGCDTSLTVCLADTLWESLTQIINEDITVRPLVIREEREPCHSEQHSSFSIIEAKGNTVVGLNWECGLESKYQEPISRTQRIISALPQSDFEFANDLHKHCE